MKKLKNIFNKLKKVSRLKKTWVLLALTIAIAIPSATLATWGPARPTFDYNDPTGRLGSLTGPVFNSMKNTPTYGDEFNFTTAKKTSDATWSNDLAVKDGDEVEIRLYIHNNANTSTNASGLGVATGVKAGIDLPEDQYSLKNEPIGFVNADNSTPKGVWDGTVISSADGKKFKLNYVKGSAKLTQRDGSGTATATLPDQFIGANGTAVGSQPGSATNGKWLGCYEHVGLVKVKVKVTAEPQPEKPNFTIKKYVNGDDAQNKDTSVKVQAGEEFDYKVDVTNTGKTELKNVKVSDKLPNGVEYIAGSLKLDGTKVNNDTDFFSSSKGVIIPSIAVGQKAIFTMKAKIVVNEDKTAEEACEPGQKTFYNNIATADPEGTGEGLNPKEDPAVINCTTPKKEPGVEITKEVSEENVALNQEFTYNVKVTNTGNVDLVNAIVQDPAPSNIEFIRTEPVAGISFEFSPSKITATIVKLKVGESIDFNVIAKVTKATEGDIVNTACVNAAEVNPEQPEKEDDCDDAPVRVVENCLIPGKEDLPKDSEKCKEDVSTPPKPEVPTETPSTGAGSALITVLSTLTVATMAFIASSKISARKS
ncbi:DUF11 domain-containing protein [Candidatus Saccharibacteria bacterium]|jgi:uncharacterized repeat protein (TIGR01451 family)|nr:DUF11 domain-containing protein [Candidatus Saccharibacteria bacterium]